MHIIVIGLLIVLFLVYAFYQPFGASFVVRIGIRILAIWLIIMSLPAIGFIIFVLLYAANHQH